MKPTDRLTVIAAALVAGCHPDTIRRRVRSGEIAYEREDVRGRIVIQRADALAFRNRRLTGRERGKSPMRDFTARTTPLVQIAVRGTD